MKNFLKYILAIVAVAVCYTAEAQEYTFIQDAPKQKRVRVEMGIGLDAMYTGIKSISSESISLTPRIGFGGHFDFGVAFGRHFAIETEVGYQRGTLMAANPLVSHKVKTTTVDIPLLLSFRVANKHLRLNLGPIFTVMNKAQYVANETTYEFGNAYPTWNAMAELAICMGGHFQIEGRYIHSLSDTLNHFEGEEFNTRVYRVSVGFSVIF